MKTLSEIFPPFKKIMSNPPLQVYQDLQRVPHRLSNSLEAQSEAETVSQVEEDATSKLFFNIF